jgi:hypothetical protein
MRAIARYTLIGTLALSGLVLAARAALGPLAGPFPVHSPLNAEALFGISLTLLLVLAARDCSEPGRLHFQPADVVLVLGLVCLTAAAFSRTLAFYFLSDDFVLLKLAQGWRPGWRPLFTTGGGDGFYRPLGYVSLAATSIWAGANPALWHALGLALHAANCILVFCLARRFTGSRWAAFFAAALFAIHGTRPEAVVWIAGRFDLLATFFVLAGLLLFLRPGGVYRLASLLSMALAMLTKESAYVFPFLLVLLLASEGSLSRSRLRALVPFFSLAAALFLYRWSLFGGIGGYRQDALGFLPALKALGARSWAVLYFPINWSIEPGGLYAGAIAAYIASLGLLAASRPRRRHLALAAGFVLLSALPPLQQLLIGPDLQKSRLLYLPSIGFCLLLAVAGNGLPGRLRWIAPGILLVASLAALQHNLDAWEYASAKAKPACVAAAGCAGASGKLTVGPLPGSVRGVYLFQNGFQECVELERHGRPLELEFTAPSPAAQWDPATDQLKCYLGASKPTRRESDWNLR